MTEKRPTIDITTVKDEYDVEDVSNVGFVRTAHDTAGAFPKVNRCSALTSILENQTCSLTIEK